MASWKSPSRKDAGLVPVRLSGLWVKSAPNMDPTREGGQKNLNPVNLKGAGTKFFPPSGYRANRVLLIGGRIPHPLRIESS